MELRAEKVKNYAMCVNFKFRQFKAPVDRWISQHTSEDYVSLSAGAMKIKLMPIYVELNR